jgi:hypothetical protein
MHVDVVTPSADVAVVGAGAFEGSVVWEARTCIGGNGDDAKTMIHHSILSREQGSVMHMLFERLRKS